MRNPPLILVVEDNDASLDILRIRVTAHNYNVIIASNGEAGFNAGYLLSPPKMCLLQS